MSAATGTRTTAAAVDRLRAARAVAVVRARDADEAVRIAEALHAGGLQAIELTFTTPGCAEAIVETRRRLGDGLLLGAGTIATVAETAAAVAAGADFLVSPHLDAALLEAQLETGTLAIPGVLTPSEAAAALRAGASVLKLFPASTAGVGHLKALLGPFPGLQVVPTGGVSVETAPAWLAAGALAVGLGGELVPKALRDAGEWDEIAANAARLLARLDREEGAA